jgi:hypothetical protein
MRCRPVAIVLASLAVSLACSEPATVLPPNPPPDPIPDPTPPIDLTAPYFDPDRLLEIEIEVAAADWDMLRTQGRDFLDVIGGEDCLAEPFGSPFTYFPGTVTVDGEKVEQVGVRKKGFIGSLDEVRPSLKVSFDEYVTDRVFSGFTKMTFNNVRQDPSLIKQCLAFGLYDQAGVLAPRCNFAHVTVNGMDLGVYTHVESIGKRFLRRHFEDDEGDLWEGTLSDFRDGWLGTFEQKTNEDIVAEKDRLAFLSGAIATPASARLAAIEEYASVEGFTRYWAVESLVAHWDGYAGNANNFFVYDDPTSNRFHFIAWGVDAAFSDQIPFIPPEQRSVVFAQGGLANAIYATPEGRAGFVAELGDLMSTIWNEDAIIAEADRMEALISDRAIRPDLAQSIDDVRAWVRARRATVEAEIAMGGADWNVPLRESVCAVERGALAAALDTTWGSFPAPNPFMSGTSTVTGTIDMNMIQGLGPGGAAAGPDQMTPGRSLLVTITTIAPTPSFAVVFVSLEDELLAPGTLAIDRQRVGGGLLFIPQPGAQPQYVATLGEGTVEIRAGSRSTNAPVSAIINGTLF